jgi:acyl dehydratase
VKPGDTLALRKQPVTAKQIVMYAGASGDFNPIHYDNFAAEKAGLRGVIAHGMLSLGFAAQLIGDGLPEFAWVKEIGGRFLSPVRPGDIVELSGKVIEVTRDAGADESIRVEISAVVGDRTVLRGFAVIVEQKNSVSDIGVAPSLQSVFLS